jgi:V/A-type H+-transporting ATPase subunit G/H
MSLEAITRIRSVEEGMDQAKADARAQAQKLAAEAEREGRALLQQGREQAEMEKAEAAAAKRREEILAQADRDCEALKKEAGSRMGKAAQAILGRVVGN